MNDESRLSTPHQTVGPDQPDFDPSRAGKRPGRPAPAAISVTVPVREHARYWFDDHDFTQAPPALPSEAPSLTVTPREPEDLAADTRALSDDARARIIAARRSAAEALAAATESSLLAAPVCSRVNG